MHSRLMNTYNPDVFRQTAHKLVDQLADYLARAVTSELESVLPAEAPETVALRWTDAFTAAGEGMEVFPALVESALADANHLHHPHYIGHQVPPPLPVAALCDLVDAFLNNAAAVYEMGPVEAVIERHLTRWMGNLIGMGDEVGGVFTSGGSLSNLTALLAMRQIKGDGDTWNRGTMDSAYSVLVSDQAHYCVKRSVQVMGWGEAGCLLVPTDASRKMTRQALEFTLRQATERGRQVLAVVGSACSTSTGSFDDLNMIADFCAEHGLWFHVDGAHGASFAASGKYSHLLKGAERADSVVWDAHKMMLMPAFCSAVIFKDNRHSYAAFAQKADYLYQGEVEDEWWTLGKRTLECTKKQSALKLYVCLKVYGTQMFADYLDSMIDRTRAMADVIKASDDFTLAIEPECNIICFRYEPFALSKEESNALQRYIRSTILESGAFYIVQTVLDDRLYLRCTVINPLTTEAHLRGLLDEVRRVGSAFMAVDVQKRA